MGFAALFCLVGAFTYANFYLAAAPYRLNSPQLGSVFFVYLLGLIVTPLSGRCLDHYGVRVTSMIGFGFAAVGLLLTLVHSLPVIIVGLALASSGVFIYQAVGTVQTGVVAGKARSSAAGLYVTFYYIGGSLGATITGWTWVAGGVAAVRVSDDGCRGDGVGDGLRQQQEDGRRLSAISCQLRRACTADLKYSSDICKPVRRSIFGSHPSRRLALLMSGRRCLGSSCGSGS